MEPAAPPPPVRRPTLRLSGQALTDYNNARTIRDTVSREVRSQSVGRGRTRKNTRKKKRRRKRSSNIFSNTYK